MKKLGFILRDILFLFINIVAHFTITFGVVFLVIFWFKTIDETDPGFFILLGAVFVIISIPILYLVSFIFSNIARINSSKKSVIFGAVIIDGSYSAYIVFSLIGSLLFPPENTVHIPKYRLVIYCIVSAGIFSSIAVASIKGSMSNLVKKKSYSA